jgi:hypothetical protein
MEPKRPPFEEASGLVVKAVTGTWEQACFLMEQRQIPEGPLSSPYTPLSLKKTP